MNNTTYLSDICYSNSYSCYNLLVQPYKEAKKNFSKALDSTQTYGQRFKHLVASALLSFPLINTVSFLALRHLGKGVSVERREMQPRERLPQNPPLPQSREILVLNNSKPNISTELTAGTLVNTRNQPPKISINPAFSDIAFRNALDDISSLNFNKGMNCDEITLQEDEKDLQEIEILEQGVDDQETKEGSIEPFLQRNPSKSYDLDAPNNSDGIVHPQEIPEASLDSLNLEDILKLYTNSRQSFDVETANQILNEINNFSF